MRTTSRRRARSRRRSARPAERRRSTVAGAGQAARAGAPFVWRRSADHETRAPPCASTRIRGWSDRGGEGGRPRRGRGRDSERHRRRVQAVVSLPRSGREGQAHDDPLRQRRRMHLRRRLERLPRLRVERRRALDPAPHRVRRQRHDRAAHADERRRALRLLRALFGGAARRVPRAGLALAAGARRHRRAERAGPADPDGHLRRGQRRQAQGLHHRPPASGRRLRPSGSPRAPSSAS